MAVAVDIVTLPYIGTLTSAEVHAFVIGLVVTFFLVATRARPMIRTEPWYFLGGIFLGALLGGALAMAAGWV